MLHLRNTVHSSGVSENGLERSREWACIRYLIGEYDTSRPESNSVDVIIKQRGERGTKGQIIQDVRKFFFGTLDPLPFV